MPERGGSSTVAGVEYQAWVAAEIMADAILDETISVQLEGKADKDGNLISIDDVIKIQGHKKEYRNCKHQAPGATNWTLSKLKQQKVFDQLKEQYLQEPNQSFFFVTESPCPLIQEAFARGAASSTCAEAKARLKGENTEGYLKEWEEVRSYLNFSDADMLRFSKQVKYERKVVEDLYKIILARLKHDFSNAKSVPVLLKSFSQEVAVRGETVSKTQILEYLQAHGCYPKSLQPADKILEAFSLASSNLVDAVSTIGQRIHIERNEVKSLLEWIETSHHENKAASLVGVMGVGKTVVMKDLYLELQRKAVPCLAIKSDCYTHIKSRKQLSDELGLQDDILHSIASVAEVKGICVVLFDQLDALSDSIARDRTAINVCTNIIHALLPLPDVKVIASVRKFDLEHDPTLSVIPFEPKIEAGLISVDQTKETLANIGLPATSFSETQFELFRIPLHLRILGEIFDPAVKVESIQTIQDLYSKLWERKIASGGHALSKIEAVNMLVTIMDERKELTVPSVMIDEYPDARKELHSNGIITLAGKAAIGFFHQSFFDYCFARSFVSENASLASKVIAEHQGLFVRSQIKQTILYLRGADARRYVRELRDLLQFDSVRFHIKDLLISLIGSQNEPIAEEVTYVRDMFKENTELRDHFLRNAYVPIWFDYLAEEYLVPLLNTPETTTLVEYFLLKIANHRTDEIIAVIDNLSPTDRKIKIISNILWELTNWTDAALSLFAKYRDQLDLSEGNLHHVIGQIYKIRKVDAIKLLFAELDREIQKFSKETDDSAKDIIGWDFQNLFEKIIKSHPDLIIEEFTKRLKEIVELARYEKEDGFCRDKAFLLYERGETLYGIWKVMTVYARELCDQIHKGNIELAERVVSILYPTGLITLNRVLTWIYSELPALYVDKAFELLREPEALLTVDGGHKSGHDARTLLRVIYSHFRDNQKQYIESRILGYEPEWEKRKDAIKRRGHSQYLALSSIPEEMLSQKGKKRLQELERKFGKYEETPPSPMETTCVGPPLPDNAYEDMTLDQWLSSFYEYDDSTSWDAPREDFLKGGVIEHSRAFKAAIQKKPDLFYDFVLGLKDKKVSSNYIYNAIEGFVEASYEYGQIRKLILYYAGMPENDVRRAIIRAIESLDKRKPIDGDLLEILAQYALNDPEPDRELHTVMSDSGHYYYGGGALSYGINTVRGSATMAITHHGFRTSDPDRVFEILEGIAGDSFISVRACIVVDLHGMLRYSRHRAFTIYQEALRDMSPELLKYSGNILWYFMHKGDCCTDPRDITRNVLRKLLKWLRTKNVKLFEKSTYCTLIPDSFKTITPYLEKMVLIDDHDASKSTGRIAMKAYIDGFEGSASFLKKIIRQGKNVRIGIADVCMANMANQKFMEKCAQVLTQLLADYMADVDESVAWHFHQTDSKDFMIFYPFLLQISSHINERRDMHFVMEYLSKSVSEHPKECIDVMKNLVQLQTENLAYNLTTDEAVTVISSAYMKSSALEDKEEAMNVIDKMYQKGYYKVKQLISALDR